MKPCPKCDNETLKCVSMYDVEVDYCSACSGIWFETGELDCVKDTTDKHLRWFDFDLMLKPESILAKETGHSCPRCSKHKLFSIEFIKSELQVDYCQQCRGVWLDQGELGQLVKCLQKEIHTKSLGKYWGALIGEVQEVVTGPEPFVEECKDVFMLVFLFQCRISSCHPAMVQAINGILMGLHTRASNLGA